MTSHQLYAGRNMCARARPFFIPCRLSFEIYPADLVSCAYLNLFQAEYRRLVAIFLP
jgi:hypothetical protein